MMKVWQLKDRPNTLLLNEEELIKAIKNGLVKEDDILINIELKFEVKVKDCIYAYYLSEVENEKDEV